MDSDTYSSINSGYCGFIRNKITYYITQLEETLSSERIKRKVISRHKAQRLKCIFYCDCCSNHFNAHIIIFKVDGYFGLAVTIFILASISVAIFEKYFTIIENM